VSEATLAIRVRSGLVETVHYGSVAVAGPDGELVATAGEVDRPFYLRSAAKPFQAHVSQQAGAELEPVELALACASHRGHPVQVAVVGAMLEKAGLDESYLRCPPAWPISQDAARRLAANGESVPRAIWNNCSGKHAGFLRACVAMGWPVESYLHPEHPLQRQVVDFVSDMSGHTAEPVGIDGCGAPVLQTTASAMARLFSRLATVTELSAVFDSMHRYPALVSSNGEGDASIAVATYSAAKGGAQGCLGVALRGRHGIAVKSWDGSGEIASLAAIAAMRQVGDLWPEAIKRLEPLARPPVHGAGEVVGAVESRLDLVMA
jgi:L-asparaginase II